MISLLDQFGMGLLIMLAALLSMVPGMDRERRDRPAGLRTHMMVGVGSCLFSLLSVYAFPGGDETRVAANVVTGVGFLGAGVIVHHKRNVKDLTTASSIWVTAAIGMAVGLGAWFLAIVVTLIVWVVLRVIRTFSKGEAEPSAEKTV